MKNKTLSFLFKLGILSVALMLLTTVFRRIIPQWITPWWPWQVVLFFVIGLLMFLSVGKTRTRNIRSFANFFMVATMIKLVIYLFIILIYAFKFPSDAKPFMLTFLFYYVCFTTFETIAFVKESRKANQNK